jgi:hypothetical protein
MTNIRCAAVLLLFSIVGCDASSSSGPPDQLSGQPSDLKDAVDAANDHADLAPPADLGGADLVSITCAGAGGLCVPVVGGSTCPPGSASGPYYCSGGALCCFVNTDGATTNATDASGVNHGGT